MELDGLKTAWLEQQQRFDATLRLNHELVRRSNAGAAREMLHRFSRNTALEAILNVVALLWLGSFAADHRSQPGFLFPAVVLAVYAIVMIADAFAQIAAARSLDYDEPVVAIQKRVSALRVRHARVVRFILVTSPLLWTPLLIVGLRALGADAYATLGMTYVWANVAFSIAWLVAAYAAARYYGPRFARSRFGAWVSDQLSGRELTSAVEVFDNVLRFEEEPVTV